MKAVRFAAVSVLAATWMLSSASVAVADPVVHDYTIQAGWGAKSWNTPETKFVMHVGDTFRVHNLDSTVEHTLHTEGTPCPHGGTVVYDKSGKAVHHGENFDSIPVGGYLDCVLTAPIENDDDEMYDHFQYDGSQGRVFLSVTQP